LAFAVDLAILIFVVSRLKYKFALPTVSCITVSNPNLYRVRVAFPAKADAAFRALLPAFAAAHDLPRDFSSTSD
jgi:hypothetical protein